MKVFKFGGASINSIERIHQVKNIIQSFPHEDLMIIISAMGKTTNALEKVALAFYESRQQEALQLFEVMKKQHLTTAKYLLVTHYNECLDQLVDFFTEAEWLLHDKPVRAFDYYYDQIVCIGELLSSCIVSHYLREAGIENNWLDARDIIKTDNHFQNANINWELTTKKTEQELSCFFQNNTSAAGTNIYITQGFIGSTDENESTTLGREGSDFSAAIFANLLNAECLTIWKDVPGVMSADPHQFKDATLLSKLNFEEVIEMAYYGAKVIHPKTIQPLQNKSIPLYVKSFLDPSDPGTIINQEKVKHLPPVIIIKNNQALMHLKNQDFSFVGEKQMSRLYEIFHEINLIPNLVQTGAVGITLCLEDLFERIDHIAIAASNEFDVQLEKGLSLLTIRHYTEAVLNKMLEQKDVLLMQKTKTTVQVVFRN